MIRVKAPGLFTTLQDLGRYGAQSQGMPVAGAMDTLGLRIANALCGNAQNVAALELSYMGPTLLVEAEAVQFGLAGAMAWRTLGPSPRYPLQMEVIHLLFLAIVVGCTSVLAIRLGRMRARLSAQKAELTEAQIGRAHV